MKAITYLRWADPPFWMAVPASLLPLWLLGLAILPASMSAGLTGRFFLLSMAAMILLLWLRWFTFDLIFYSFFPIISIFIFGDEISPTYLTPFILFCTLLLTIGIAGYRLSLHKYSVGLAWLILLVVFIATWMLAENATQNYWQMVTDLGYGCDPYMPACPAPVPANGTPWWTLFLRLT